MGYAIYKDGVLYSYRFHLKMCIFCAFHEKRVCSSKAIVLSIGRSRG